MQSIAKSARSTAIALATLCAAACAQRQGGTPSPEQLPAWLNSQIAELEAKPKAPKATAIWKLRYRNEDAYLFIAPCCDQFDVLYNATGTAICAPAGGITGRGDGKCPDALSPQTQSVVVWPKPGKGKK